MTKLNEILLLTFPNSIALHMLPAPPRSSDELGGWRKREAALHRLCADLIEGLVNIAAVPYMENNQRIIIELSGGETLDDTIAEVMNVLDDVDCAAYPGVLTRRGAIIDPDFTDNLI